MTLMAAWALQAGPQLAAIQATWCTELFFGGARGGGKSDFLLGDFGRDVATYEISTMLAAATGTPLYVSVLVAVTTGVRRGELLGIALVRSRRRGAGH
jgi:hypothetical protein